MVELELRRSDIGFGRLVVDDTGVTRRFALSTTWIAWGEIRDYRLKIETRGMRLEVLYRERRAVQQLTRPAAGHGQALDLERGVYKLADQPLDRACACDACMRHSRSYLHHLMKCQEPLGWQLLAQHNLVFYVRLMAAMRAHIRADTFTAFYREQRELLARADPDHPPGPRPRVKRRKPQAQR